MPLSGINVVGQLGKRTRGYLRQWLPMGTPFFLFMSYLKIKAMLHGIIAPIELPIGPYAIVT